MDRNLNQQKNAGKRSKALKSGFYLNDNQILDLNEYDNSLGEISCTTSSSSSSSSGRGESDASHDF